MRALVLSERRRGGGSALVQYARAASQTSGAAHLHERCRQTDRRLCSRQSSFSSGFCAILLGVIMGIGTKAHFYFFGFRSRQIFFREQTADHAAHQLKQQR